MAVNAKKEQSDRYDPNATRILWENLRDQVRAALPIDRALEDLAGANLLRRGKIAEACCPFHTERTPSFRVNIDKGTYQCFGVGCGAQGDVFALIRDTQNLDFQAAMIFGADRSGVDVPAVLRNYVEGRTRIPKTAGRTVVRYPNAAPKVAPSVMGDPKLIAIPDGIRRPVAGRDFTLWNNGGAKGDSDFDKRSYRPQMVHEYRDADGVLLMSILRVQGRDKKFFIPARLLVPTGPCPVALLEKAEQGGQKLAWVSVGPGVGEAKPIYGMEDLRAWIDAGGRNVLIVEGEKTRDAARRLIASADPEGRWLVLSPMGGSKAAIYADWAPLVDALRGRAINFVTWPDADKPLTRPNGDVEDRLENAVTQVLSSFAQRVIDMEIDGKQILGRITPPEGVVSGWDLADAEEEGWTGAQVIDFIKSNARRVALESLVLREPDIIPASDPTEPNSPC